MSRIIGSVAEQDAHYRHGLAVGRGSYRKARPSFFGSLIGALAFVVLALVLIALGAPS